MTAGGLPPWAGRILRLTGAVYTHKGVTGMPFFMINRNSVN